MAGILDLRLDFLFFLHGIALALLASSAWGLSHLENRRTWRWLALFAGAQAAFVWSRAVSHDIGTIPFWQGAQRLALILSFVSLTQFSRARFADLGRTPVPPWLNAVPIGLALLAAMIGGLHHLAWAFPAFGMISGALVFLAMQLRAGEVERNARQIRRCGWSVGFYAIASGFFSDETVFFQHLTAQKTPPLWWFLFILLLAFLAAAACWSVGIHYSIQHHASLGGDKSRPWSKKRTAQLAIFALIAGICWFACERTMRHKDATMRNEIILRANLIAASVPREQVEALSWSGADLAKRDYQELKERMLALVKADDDLRFVLLVGQREGKAYFLVDSEKPESTDYSPPGEYYGEATAAYLEGMSSHQSFVLGPIADHWGTWIIASVPLGQFGPEKCWVNAEVDIKASDWSESVKNARLPVILIMLVFSLLLLTFSYNQERIHESLAKLSASEQRNSSIVEGSPNCVQVIDPQWRCVAINQNGANLLNVTKADLVGRAFLDLWPAYEHKALRTALEQAFSGHAKMLEANYVRPDGESIIWRIVFTPVPNSNKIVDSVVAILIDISDFRFSEKALTAAKEAAEAANKAKSEFLAVMSHEIRTPLGGVIGMLNVLKKHPMSPEQQLYTDLAHENAENLLGLLDDILDAAKVEAGKLTIENIPFDPTLEFNRVLEPMRIRAEGKGLDLTWKIAPDMPAALRGDPTRLRQVIANLLSNALKFTEHGKIETTISTTPAAPGKVSLRITVKDTGIGIPREKLVRLFQRFEQADLSTTRRFGGTGLGLSIVKSLAELMHGEVSVESVQGTGSTFTYVAVLGEATPQDLGVSGSRSTQDISLLPKHKAKLHVLCAEDDSTNQVAAEFLVKQMGHTIEFVENGKMAVEWLSAQRATVVLMDNRMPIMDGFQATHLIRDTTSPVLDHNVYIIANTANAASGYRDRCLASGMNDYLTKPLREGELHAAFERAIEYYERGGGILPPMREEPHLHFAQAEVVPARTVTAPAPKGLSADELLAILDEAEATPLDPTANLPAEAVTRITEQYFKEAPSRFSEIRTALAQRNAEALGRAAHSLKSSSRYVKADALSELSAEMERLADNGKFDEIPSLFQQAEKQFQALQEHRNTLSKTD
jgi:PAS domain S-box-containing protein